jgi:hypothetical protein
MEDRIFIRWDNGAQLTITNATLTALVLLHGAPDMVAFRRKGKGYITKTLVQIEVAAAEEEAAIIRQATAVKKPITRKET